ncbi:MAG: VWA domain-containing protein [Planctomycetia bacterium]|nr:VWA domain-containing protein [Planctomycetia bacterium]
MDILTRLKRWWQFRTGEEETPFDGDTPAWVISVGLHLLVLVALAIWGLMPTREPPALTLSPPVEPFEEEPLPEEFNFSPDPMEKIGANSVGGVDAALALAPTESDVSVAPTEINPSAQSPVKTLLNFDLATAPNISKMSVRGAATGVGTTGAEGAIDRITQEILLSLEERKTLVVWFIDQSGSLNRTRQQIYQRFDRIYEELGVIERSGNDAFTKHDNQALLTAMMSFGKNIDFVVEPTDDLATIKKGLKDIPNDDTGLENVFTAVVKGVEKYQRYRNTLHRNVMFVVVSDEVGDDEPMLDTAVAACQRVQVPVYCIGVPAPFGQREAYIKYVDPDPNFDQSAQWVSVRQGPESLRPENVKLGFWGENDRWMDEMDSGFGPFALTRLCYETGGIYFAVHANRTADARARGWRETPDFSSRLTQFFDPAVMRRYRPDYLSIKEYDLALQQNKAKLALVRASNLTWLNQMDGPQLTFPRQNEGELKRLLDDAQKVAAKLEPKIDQLYTALQLGEKDRPKIIEPRWQAGYDLAYGRVLAAKVRTETYNQMLALLKGGKNFQDKNNDTWELRPANTTVGSSLERMAKQARELLEGVVRDHPGTPWALLAEKELRTPFGWEWTEKHTGVNDPRPMDGNGNANPAADALNRLPKPKPKRQNVKL